ncbi:efflux RND transporter periplasmic adaptor subunit [Rohdeia mirabilis]
MLAGRVDLLVQQFDRVEAGTPLFRLLSPQWRTLQQELAAARAQIDRARIHAENYPLQLAGLDELEVSLERSAGVWDERIEQLESLAELGGGTNESLAAARSSRSDVEVQLATLRSQRAQLVANHAEHEADREAASRQFDALLATASTLVGHAPEELMTPVASSVGERPLWATLDEIEVRADHPGVVAQFGVTDGAWADQRAAVVTLTRPELLRFRASGLQSDMGALRDGLLARIVPPTPTLTGRAVPLNDTMHGTLSIGLTADPDDRTIDLFVVPDSLSSWGRAGVTALLEIVTDETARPETAIPLSAVQRDGLIPVIFRRDPDDPNQAIRLEADLGIDDGRWVSLLSGVREGDEVVLDGAFQLMLSTSGTMQKGGHFHSDGTFHEGED